MSPAKPTKRVISPKIHLSLYFYFNKWWKIKDWYEICYITPTKRIQNLRNVESEFPLEMWHESLLCPKFPEWPQGKGWLLWSVRDSLGWFHSWQMSSPPQETEKNLNKCKEIEIELFACLVIMTDAWGLFDKEIKNRLCFMVYWKEH